MKAAAIVEYIKGVSMKKKVIISLSLIVTISLIIYSNHTFDKNRIIYSSKINNIKSLSIPASKNPSHAPKISSSKSSITVSSAVNVASVATTPTPKNPTPAPKSTSTPKSPSTTAAPKTTPKSPSTTPAPKTTPIPTTTPVNKIIPYVPGSVLKAVLNEGITGHGWIAGIDIAPGTYYSYVGCSIIVASPTIKQYNIITQEGQLAQITLTPNMQMGTSCDMTMGTPTIQPTINSGMHIVGQDILPGTYSPSQNCIYWQGSFTDLNSGIWSQIPSSNLPRVRAGSTFTVSNATPGLYFEECGVLTKVN